MIKLNSFLGGVLLIIGVFAVAEAGLLLRDIRNSQREITASVKQTVDDMDAAVIVVRGAAVNASLVLGRIEDASQSWKDASERQARYWTGLQDKSVQVMNNLTQLSESLDRLVNDTNRSVNASLIPQATETLAQSEAALKSLDTAIVQASNKANLTLDDIHRLAADPSLTGIFNEIHGSVENVTGITEQVELASRELPEIARNIQSISKTTKKFALPISIARIASLLTNWVPWLF